MITLRDFQVGSFEQKCEVVTTKSNYVLSRVLGENKVYLYHTDQFFIEVYYSPRFKKVTMINAFNDLSGLAPYEELISLEDLNL